MILSYFTDQQIIHLLISSLVITASVVTFHLGKRRAALLLLVLGALGLGFFIAGLDPFLVLWDEQYHALVAKNMLDAPFRPTLYAAPLLEYEYKNWTANHVWLHKQPLFLWQMALSLKLFGINELSVRIPSIIMHAFAALMIYRIGRISYSRTAGFYGAVFFSFAYYPLELLAGKYETDHNDVAFLFYVTASFWAWFEYQHSAKKYWLIVIGILSGCAVLVKWLVGLLIYSVWILTLGVNDKKNWLRPRSYSPVLLSFIISLVVFIPWQLFILNRYPEEARYEYQLNAEHFFRAVENHGGDVFFHFNAFKDLYGAGDLVPFLLLAGLFLFVKNAATGVYRVAVLSAVVITYGFYTAAATKMPSFCMIVSPFVFLALGVLIDSILRFLNRKTGFKWIETLFRPIAILVICFFLIDLPRIANYHTDWKPNDNRNRKADLEQMAFIKQLSGTLREGKYVVFNVAKRYGGHIPVMFYTGYIAYDFIPGKEQLEKIKQQPYEIAVQDNGNLPDYIRNDNEITIIE